MSKDTSSWFGEPINERMVNLAAFVNEMGGTAVIFAMVPNPNNPDDVETHLYYCGDVLWLYVASVKLQDVFQREVDEFLAETAVVRRCEEPEEDTPPSEDGDDAADWWKGLRH